MSHEEVSHSSTRYRLKRGQTLFNNLVINHIHTPAKCGGKGICGGCRIKLLSEQKYCNTINQKEMSLLSEQERREGWRLSCQLYCIHNITLSLASE